jgi:hypothetical protein
VGTAVYFTNYEEIMSDPKTQIEAVTAWLKSLDRFGDLSTVWNIDRATAAITPDLQHQLSDEDDDDDQLLLDEHRQLIARLSSLQGGHRSLVASAPISESGWTTSIIKNRREIGWQTKALESNLTETGTELTRVGGELTRVGGELTRVGGELTRVEGELTRVQADRESMSVELLQAKRSILIIHASTSWRVTRPLRAMIDWARRDPRPS